MTDKEKFKLANNGKFHDACLDLMDNQTPLKKNPLQTIGDRIKFIEILEKNGFTIVEINKG
jgi:hypothetical protein